MAVLELESPFKEIWRKGYLVTNKEPRRNVILLNSDSDRTTISYAKYLMSVHLGRILDKSEIVDHINGDKLDDRLENYQILSARDNVRKGVHQNGVGEKYIRFICGVCGITFDRKKRNTHLIPCNSHRLSSYCSRTCSAQKDKIPSTVIDEFRKNPEISEKILLSVG